MGCSSSTPSPSARDSESCPTGVDPQQVDVSELYDSDLELHRTKQLTAYRAKQEAQEMINDPSFTSRPRKEQIELQREFIRQLLDMSGDQRAASIAQATLQELLKNHLFVSLLDQQPIDSKEEVLLVAESKHSSPRHIKALWSARFRNRGAK